MKKYIIILSVFILCITTITGCSKKQTHKNKKNPSMINVVVLENFWSSIASQLTNSSTNIHIHTIINKSNIDPHDYQPTTKDASLISNSQYIIMNGYNYDSWVLKILKLKNKNKMPGILDISKATNAEPKGNPHIWYSEKIVNQAIDKITNDYITLDPKNEITYNQLHDKLKNTTLQEYHNTVNDIKNKYANTPIGGSESIVRILANTLNLNLITPDSFLNAITEESDVSQSDNNTTMNQIKTHQIRIYIYNSQNKNNIIDKQIQACKENNIPIVTITETLLPNNATFQDWQLKQLQQIKSALL